MNVVTGQPLSSAALQQPPSASPTEQKPTSLQLLRQQQLELKEREREREREKEKERQQQQQAQQQQQQEPKPSSIQGSEPSNAQSTLPFGGSPAAMNNTNVGSAAALATGAQGVKPETTSNTASLTRSTTIKPEDEIMMPPPPPPSHANANSQGGHETVPAAAAAAAEPPTHIGTRSGTPSSSKQTVSAAEPSGPVQIFKATYSGVPVFEMICKGVAVMRRRSDSYLNATQILKVADFDKPQRTRILEREVQKGEHEKVQGGYGKYQGMP
jgi:hypothetical protein